MNFTTLALVANIIGLVMGGITLIGLIVSMCKSQLPSNKIKTMDTLLTGTERTLQEVIEEGFVVHEYAEVALRRLAELKQTAGTLRRRTHKMTTLSEDCMGFLDGTSTTIDGVCKSLRKLRAEVITVGEERRRRLLEMASRLPPSLLTPLSRELDAEITESDPFSGSATG